MAIVGNEAAPRNGKPRTYDELRAAELAIMEDPDPPTITAADEARALTIAGMADRLAEPALTCWGTCSADAPCANCRFRRQWIRLHLHRLDHGCPVHPSDAAGYPATADSTPATGYDLILRHFRSKYQPSFRHSTKLYSGALGRDVTQAEATAGAGRDLIDQLAGAIDAPRDGNGVRRGTLPYFFRTWAPSAWVDLLDSLPDEEGSAEIVDPARDEFRRRVSAALLSHVTIRAQHTGKHGDAVDIERRPLIDWARMFAKPARFVEIRGYRLWCRRDDDRLRVALRVELFGQLPGHGDLAAMGQRRFSELAKIYDVGVGAKTGGGDVRVVELLPEFLDAMFTGPAPDGQDGRTDAGSHARAREGDSASVSGDNGEKHGESR